MGTNIRCTRPFHLFAPRAATVRLAHWQRPEADPVPCQPGCWIVAPLAPQTVQREHWRSLSLETLAPHRMTNGAIATGVRR